MSFAPPTETELPVGEKTNNEAFNERTWLKDLGTPKTKNKLLTKASYTPFNPKANTLNQSPGLVCLVLTLEIWLAFNMTGSRDYIIGTPSGIPWELNIPDSQMIFA